eukprot:scaffold10306_cov104-Isochrysis_galbana.AAC.2
MAASGKNKLRKKLIDRGSQRREKSTTPAHVTCDDPHRFVMIRVQQHGQGPGLLRVVGNK